MGAVWIDIGIVLLLLIVGGLFTATELALVSLRSGQLEAIAQRGGRGARVAKPATEPTRYLAAVQIGSIVAGFFAAAFASAALAEPVAAPLASLRVSPGHRGRDRPGITVFPATKLLLPRCRRCRRPART